MRQQIENVRDGLKAADRTLVHCREIIAAYRKAIDDAGMRVYYLPKGGGMALCKKEEEETPPNDALPTTPVPAGGGRTMSTELDRAEKMLLLPRAEWCAKELERSAREMDEGDLQEAANGTALMARTMRELREALGEQAALAERLGSGARFLCDLLQQSNEQIEALYGGEFDLEQATAELRSAIKAWEESR